MNQFIEILNRVTHFILHFNLVKFLQGAKPIVVLAALAGMLLLLAGAFFSLFPQF